MFCGKVVFWSDRIALDIEKDYKNIIPAQRFATPEEIASATSFLCSKKASYINGINLPIDGGYSGNL